MDRATWLEERRKGICSTDIAAIAGVHPYKSALEVYVEKVDGTNVDLSGKPEVEWGNRHEPTIAAKYAERHGVTLESPGLVFAPDEPWRRATADRFVVPGGDWKPGDRRRGLEIKTAGARQAHRWGESGSGEYPEEYYLQCQWCMSVCDYDEWDLAVLIGGNDYREYRIARDRVLEGNLIEIGQRFWEENVLARVPPTLDGSDSAAAYLLAQFPRNVEPLIAAPPEADQWVERYREAEEKLALAEREKAKAKHELQAIIGEHDGIEGGWGKILWKTQAGRPSWKAIAEELGATPELIEKHRSDGTRVFRPYFKKGA